MEEPKKEESKVSSLDKYKSEERYLLLEKFKRTERITLLVVALITAAVLVYAIVNYSSMDMHWNQITISTSLRYNDYYIWDTMINKTLPAGSLPGAGILSYPGYPPYYSPDNTFFPPVVTFLFFSTVGITSAVFLPMALRKKTRYTGAVCMMVSSYIFAALLWVCSLGILLGVNGLALAIVGVCLGYVGVIPLAFFFAISFAIYGNLVLLVPMLVLIACFIIVRKLKTRALERCDESIMKPGAVQPGAGERFKRVERVALSVVFCILMVILIFTFINGSNLEYAFTKPNKIAINEIDIPHDYWVWNSAAEKIAPAGLFSDKSLLSYTGYQPDFPLLFWLAAGTSLILLPMSLIKKTRHAGAVGMIISSYVFAAFLWIFSLAVVYYAWGPAGAAAGACLGFAGVIPLAAIIVLGQCLIAGWWAYSGPLLFFTACFIFTRLLANRAKKKYAEEEESTAQGLEAVKNEEMC